MKMDFTTPRWLAAQIYGDEIGAADIMLVEVDEKMFETIKLLYERSLSIRGELNNDVELAHRWPGYAQVMPLSVLDDDDFAEFISNELYDFIHGLDGCAWFEGDPVDVKHLLDGLTAYKEAHGRDYNDAPATLDAERLVVEAGTGHSWSCNFTFELRKSDHQLDSHDISPLFNLWP